MVGVGYDSGGRTAAALALAAQFEPDPARKVQLIATAREWYEAGDRVGKLAPRLPDDPYPSSTGQDDMALAAIELYRASGEPQDLLDAVDWIDGVDVYEAPHWDAVGAFAAAELCGAAGLPAPSADARAAGCTFLRSAARSAASRLRKHVLATAGYLGFGTTATHGGAGAALAMAADAGFPAGKRSARTPATGCSGGTPGGARSWRGSAPAPRASRTTGRCERADRPFAVP